MEPSQRSSAALGERRSLYDTVPVKRDEQKSFHSQFHRPANPDLLHTTVKHKAYRKILDKWVLPCFTTRIVDANNVVWCSEMFCLQCYAMSSGNIHGKKQINYNKYINITTYICFIFIL